MCGLYFRGVVFFFQAEECIVDLVRSRGLGDVYKRQQVMGLQAVFADGSIVTQLEGLPKETAGPHLPSLLVGSEGTLAVVTAARLRLVPWFRATAAALIACDSLVDAVSLLPQLRQLPNLDAVGLLMPEALAIACKFLDVRPPVAPSSAGAFVMVDCAAHHDPALWPADAPPGRDPGTRQ